MFRKIRDLFKPLPLIETWALHNANRCSADEIIAASIVQSFAKDFGDWSSSGKIPEPNRWWRNEEHRTELRNESKDIHICRYATCKDRDNDGIGPYVLKNERVEVNGILMDKQPADEIFRQWDKITLSVERAQKAAEDAKAKMDRNEKAWDLAEKLLGMKRNEFGALVPVNTVTQ